MSTGVFSETVSLSTLKFSPLVYTGIRITVPAQVISYVEEQEAAHWDEELFRPFSFLLG
jgi:hypothetical protein